MMGHGHVIPNPDGSKARCGGPRICTVCALEAARQQPEPILIRCEGSHHPTHDHGHAFGMCKMCGEMVITDDDGIAYHHKRKDLLAMLDRGDFDRPAPPPRPKAAPLRSYCAPCQGTGKQIPPGGRRPAPCPACDGEGVR